MADKPIARVPFQRGPERRKQDTDISADGRRSDNERRRNDLSWATLFRGVENQALEEVFADCEVLVLAPGTPLLRPGQANDSVFVLLSGELTVKVGGKSTVLRTLDSCTIPANEEREIINHTNSVTSMIVVMPYPEKK